MYSAVKLWIGIMLLLLSYILADTEKNELDVIHGKLESAEVCNMEMFNATCPHNHVIMVTTARYGRMQVGHCVKRDLGYIGCAADVLMILDTKCSGRAHCGFSLPEQDLYNSQPCPEDVSAYLHVTYQCVKVTSDSGRLCKDNQKTILSESVGYIKSFTAEDKDLASVSCPWIIRVHPGQRINLTLFNFNRMPSKTREAISPTTGVARSNPDERLVWRSEVCYDYATISEGGNVIKMVTVCGGERREKYLFESRSNSVEIVLVNRLIQQKLGAFLIKYEAVSCPDFGLIPGGEVKRDGDLAIITCTDKSEVWYLTCKGNQWSGKPGNCTSASASSAKAHQNSNIEFPYGILIVVAVGVALGVLLGGLLLIFAIFYMKRRRSNEELRMRAASHAALHEPDLSLHSPGSGKLTGSCYFDPGSGPAIKRPTWDLSLKCIPSDQCGSSCKDVHRCHMTCSEVPLHPVEFITMPAGSPDCLPAAAKISMRDLSSLHRSVPNRLQSGRTCHHHTYDFPTCL